MMTTKPAYERAREAAAEAIARSDLETFKADALTLDQIQWSIIPNEVIELKDWRLAPDPRAERQLKGFGFVKLDPEAQLPTYGSDEAAGADVRSIEDLVIPTGEHRLVKTGLGCVIPPNWELQVRPRSGLAAKYGVTVLNAPGTIDSDYTGELKVILINHGPGLFYIKKGDRIAQIVPTPVHRRNFQFFDAAPETDRGSEGFGSTGVA